VQLVKETILPMVSSVKTKLGRAKAGDKKSWKGWLKSAAKQLLHHGCDRAWLTAHVFQLKNTRKESAEFDPMAGDVTSGSPMVARLWCSTDLRYHVTLIRRRWS